MMTCVVGCIVLIVVERCVPDPISGIFSSLVFLGTVVIVGLLGGWRWSLLSMSMGLLSKVFLFPNPLTYEKLNTVNLLRLGSFGVLGGLFILLCEMWKRALARIELRQGQLQNEVNERKRAQMAERDRADELMTTLASIGDGVIRIDAEGIVRYMNPVAEDMVGWTSLQASGRTLSDVFHILNASTREPIKNPAATSIENGRIVGLSSDVILVSRDQCERYIEDSASPINDISGKVIGSVLVFRDISARQRDQAALRESERRYRAIGESIHYGIWNSDASGRFTYASESFLRLIGMTQEECSEFGWANAIHPEEHDETLAAWTQCVQTGSRWDRENRFKGADGKWHHILSRGIPVHSETGEINSWVGIVLDISHLKNVEAELRDIDRRKDEFLAILAHELRNPLAPIVNSLQVLKSSSAETGDIHRASVMIERQVHHLVRLVDDLLDVSRVMQEKIELRRELIDIASVVARAIETVQPLIDAKNHRLKISMPSHALNLNGDPVRLTQVVGNLLTNAAKYTEPNGVIELVASHRAGKICELIVRDNGIGIEPELLPRIFEMFVQGDHRSTKSHGGLGVGLTLVKNLVELHGGTVSVQSDGLNKGSEFVLHLPLAMSSESNVTRGAANQLVLSSRLNSNLRFLVVDDNTDAALSLAMLLKMQGHDVRVAANGSDALETAGSFIPHFVLLDLGMPVMDGFEVSRRMRQMSGLESTVIVALTGWGQTEDRRRTSEAGFDHHLLKPLDPKALETILADHTRSFSKA